MQLVRIILFIECTFGMFFYSFPMKQRAKNVPFGKKITLVDLCVDRVVATCLPVFRNVVRKKSFPHLHGRIKKSIAKKNQRKLFAECLSLRDIGQSVGGYKQGLVIDCARKCIEKLEPGVFEDSRFFDVEMLDLSYNDIGKISPEAFSGLCSLKSLYLSFNPIHVIPAKMFCGAPNLEMIVLSYTLIKTVDITAFKICENLRYLLLAGKFNDTFGCKVLRECFRLDSVLINVKIIG